LVVENAIFAFLLFITLFDNCIFSYVFVDWFSSRILSFEIHFLSRYFSIASDSDNFSSLPFHHEGTNTKSLPVAAN
jgi:hypothetical protein